MRISIIIPSYRPEEYLYECLEAIRNQTLNQNEFETLVVLNGCKEPYFEQIQKYINVHSSNIRLLQTDVPGVSNARNIGIEAARGEYLTFVDDDDIVSPTYLEDLLEVSSPTCVGCANSFAFVDDVSEQIPNFISNAFQKCKSKKFSTFNFRSFLSPPWCKMIHRDIIGVARFPIDLKKGEDCIFCFACSIRIADMKLSSEQSVYYQRLRKGSAMRRKNTIGFEFCESMRQEFALFAHWIKYPFKYNILYTASRVLGIWRNFVSYITK